MPSSFSPEFLEKIRQPPPAPFVNWPTWQRQLFAWGVSLAWLALALVFGANLVATWSLPACERGLPNFFTFSCHSTPWTALCLLAVLSLVLLHLRFAMTVYQIGYIRRSNFGVYEDPP